jgi:hypothetical protein
MPLSPRPVRATATGRPFSWVFGTTASGPLDAQAFAQAAALVRQERARNPAAVGWLLDASKVTSDPDMATAIALSRGLKDIRAAGIQYVAVVLPPQLASRVDLVNSESMDGLVVRAFLTERQGISWFDRRCPVG